MRRVVGPPTDVDLHDLAKGVDYIGSPEHKDTPSFAGAPKLRADASRCPRELASQREKVLGWLRTAIKHGAVGALWEGGHPRYVWFRDGDVVYEGRLVNRTLGQYKGYPLNRNEWPAGIEDIYG